MTNVTQTYTPSLNVSITVEADGTLRGVSKWVTGSPARETERFGSLDYTRPRVAAPAPKVETELDRRLAFARTHEVPTSLRESWIPLVLAVRHRFDEGVQPLNDAVDVVNHLRDEQGLPLIGEQSGRTLRYDF